MLEDFSTMKSLERWYTWSIFFEWSTTSRYPCPNIRTGWMVHSWLIRSITHTRRQHTWGVQVLPTTEDLYLPLHLLLIWSMSYYNFMDRDDWGPKICQALPQNKVSRNLPKNETAAQTHHMNRAIQHFPSSPGFGRWSSYSKNGRCLKHWKENLRNAGLDGTAPQLQIPLMLRTLPASLVSLSMASFHSFGKSKSFKSWTLTLQGWFTKICGFFSGQNRDFSVWPNFFENETILTPSPHRIFIQTQAYR